MQSGVIGIRPGAHSSAHPSLPAAPVLPCTTLGETLRHAAHQLGQVAQLLAMRRLAIPGQELRHALLELGLREHTVLGEVFLLACGEVLAQPGPHSLDRVQVSAVRWEPYLRETVGCVGAWAQQELLVVVPDLRPGRGALWGPRTNQLVGATAANPLR